MSQLLGLVTAVVVIAALYLAKIVLLPFALAVLFTFLLAPVVGWLEKIHLPRAIAIFIVLAAFGSGVGYLGWTFVGQLVQLTDHLPDYRENISNKVAAVHQTQNTSFSRAQREVEKLARQLDITGSTEPSTRKRHAKALGSSAEHPVVVQEVSQSHPALNTLHGILGPLAFLLLIIVFTFFMLLQRESLRNRLILLSAKGNLNTVTQAMDEASSRVSHYFALQALVNTCYGAIIFTAMHVIGLPHALFWGALAGLLRFIPYIGAPVAALLPTLFSMAVFHGWTETLTIMAVFFVLEVTTANFIEPHLYGKHTGLSSLAILVAAVFWTLIWGPVGLILSVPLTVCLAVVGTHVPKLEFLSVLLGDQPAMPPSAHYYQRLLAEDQHEASQVLETYLKEHTLADLYDSVVIPALSLSEQDRHRNALDEAAVRFIDQTTEELIQELGVSTDRAAGGEASVKTPAEDAQAAATTPQEPVKAAVPLNVLCIATRDQADELVALMLAQLLEQAGHTVQCRAPGDPAKIAEEVGSQPPDLVCLSALPPYAIAHARNAFRKLRARNRNLKIAIGLWDYAGDAEKAAREISGGEQQQIFTTLAQVVALAAGPEPQNDEASTPEQVRAAAS